MRGIDFETEVVASAVEELNAFFKTCRTQEVEVVLAYPPLPYRVIDSSRAALKKIEGMVSADLIMPVINSPFEAGLPISQFFDTKYHLTGEGAQRRTQDVIDGLNRLRLASKDSDVH